VDLKAQSAHSVSPYDAIKRLSERVAKIPNVLPSPAPSVEALVAGGQVLHVAGNLATCKT